MPAARFSSTRYDAFGRARYSWLPELVATLGDGSAATSGPKDETSYDGFDDFVGAPPAAGNPANRLGGDNLNLDKPNSLRGDSRTFRLAVIYRF